MNDQTDEKAKRKRIARGIALGCLGAVALAVLALFGCYYLLFGHGDTTVYAKGYSEAKFQSITEGMTQKQVIDRLGPPLEIGEQVVFTKELPQNSHEEEYAYFEEGKQISGSVLLRSRSQGKTIHSIAAALSLLTPQERKLTRIKQVWVYSKPGAPLSQQHKFRQVIFDERHLVRSKISTEWID